MGMTSSVTATMSSPKVLLMTFRRRIVFSFAPLCVCDCRIRLCRIKFITIEAKAACHAGPVGGVSLVEVLNLQLLNPLRNRLHAGHDVTDQALARVGAIKRKRLPGRPASVVILLRSSEIKFPFRL
jgi:hypothetical protein